MKYNFSPAAKQELIEAVDYYECQQPGLGIKFSSEVQATIARIIEYPNSWTQLDDIFHRCLTQRFPYGIIYFIDKDTLNITAVMNLHRNPGYWRSK